MSPHNCENTQAEFSALLDNELSDDQRRVVMAAVRECTTCAAALEEFREAVRSLSQLKQAAPPTFLKDVQQQIRVRSKGRFFGKRFLLFGRIPFEWVSLVMIMAMLAYYIVTMQSSPTQVTPLP
jgi:anti-sigma factor RsiW